MNYSAHYDKLISRAQNRDLVGYRERHHVVPRCMGGADTASNIVCLTPEEHYVAHQLLVRIYPTILELVSAAVLMAKRCKSTNKIYGWLRRRASKLNTGRKLPPHHCAAIAASQKNRTFSPAHRENLARALRGKKKPPISEAQRAAVSAANLGRPKSPEHRAKLAAVLARHRPDNTGRVRPAEERAKVSAALRGNTIWLGRKHRPETIAKMRVARLAHYARKAVTCPDVRQEDISLPELDRPR